MDNNTYLDVCLLLLLALNSEAVKNRWNEYFDKLYNDPHEVEDDVLLSFPSSRNEEEIPGIEEDEVTAAIAKMKNGKTPGIDNVTVEELRTATKGVGLKTIHGLFQSIWEIEEVAREWKRSIIVPVHKKQDKLDRLNYRGISLLCHTGKIFSSIILQRIRKRTEEILSGAHAGFRPGRSTIDQNFTLRQPAEKYGEFSRELFVCYVDFRKAFDSVWQKGLWTVMRYPEKIVMILENAYRDTFSAVRVGGSLTEWFRTIVGHCREMFFHNCFLPFSWRL